MNVVLLSPPTALGLRARPYPTALAVGHTLSPAAAGCRGQGNFKLALIGRWPGLDWNAPLGLAGTLQQNDKYREQDKGRIRAEKRGREAIPELDGDARAFALNSPQNVQLSPGNCPGAGFELVVAAIRGIRE